ncbi:MAG: hypothetical protein RG740_06815, partial [Acholeplasmataceae bacterium]|nr:hypothetical protein [Acholeplasmataceae bacterium]
MTRFATIQFITEEYAEEFQIVDKTDYSIVVSLGENCHVECDKNIIKPKESLKLRSQIHRLKIINELLKDNALLSEYPNVDIELDYEKNKIIFNLNKFYENLIFSEFKSHNQLSRFLSDEMERKYYRTLHIVNDQINMFYLTSIQANAVNLVLEKILENLSVDLGNLFTGTKPADLVFYTVIEKMPRMSKNRVSYEDLSKDLDDFLLKNTSGDLSELIEIAIKEPYGIRPRLAILVTFMIIIDKWKDVLLFNKGNFIPRINTVELVDGILYNSGMRYVFSRFDNTHREYLEGLNDLFGESGENVKARTLSVRVCSSMYNWYLNLPVITQQMQDLSLSEQKLLGIIAKARINPKESIDDLIVTFGEINDIVQFKNNLENHFEDYKNRFLK